MIDNPKAALATGIASGYLLGRSKKAKLAFAVASFVVSRKIGMTPARLALHGAKRLKDSPQVAALTEQLREDLLQAGKSAATAAASQRLGSLADAVQARTRALGGGQEEPGPDEEGEARDESNDETNDEADDVTDEETDEEDEEDDEEEDEDEEGAGAADEERNGSAEDPNPSPKSRASAKTAKTAKSGTRPGNGGPRGKRTRERTKERVKEREKREKSASARPSRSTRGGR